MALPWRCLFVSGCITEEKIKHCCSPGGGKIWSGLQFFAGAVRIPQAEKIIGLLNAEDFDSLQSLVVQDMQEIMNKERMDEGKARISEDWGDFVSIETMQDAEIIQRGAHIAAVYVTAEYENIEVHYTLAFNEDMKLASFGIQ